MTTPDFEQGPIRPPSEAHSLLVRVMRNCTWNRCTFCPVYKGTKSSQRPVEEVLADVDAMAAAAEVLGGVGVPTQELLANLNGGGVPHEAVQVALFLREGGRSAFLQDADPFTVKPHRLAAVLRRIRERFPSVTQITTYGRATTVSRRRDDEMAELASAGLTRVHLGMESGSDVVLQETRKGATAADLVAAGQKVLQAGLELCFYLMPGLGGRAHAADHVRGTAAVIRAVAAAAPAQRPLVVRLRTAAVAPDTPLAERERLGEFELPNDVEVVQELHALLQEVGGARFELRSDHALNLLPEIAGSLPAQRDYLMGVLDEYLGLAPREQALFAVGARLGVFQRLADRQDERRRAALFTQLGTQARGEGALDVDELMAIATRARSRFI